jgi:predicted PurR-regulated permease PerM
VDKVQPDRDNSPINPVIHNSVQLLALAVLLVWCFRIVEPFITPLVWGSVMAIALHPLHRVLTRRLKNRRTLSATLITLLMIALVVGPAVWLLLATVQEFRMLGEAYRAGELQIPPPSVTVKSWPLVGNALFDYWSQAHSDLSELLTQHKEQVKAVLLGLFDLLKSTGKGILLFAVSIIISGVLLAYAKPAGDFMKSFLNRIAGTAGESMAESAELTVRNVAKGVLGVAIIQSILAGIGFVLAGVPFAGLWILVCLVLAIVQIGLLPVTIGVIIYIWGQDSTLTATLLTIWMLFVGIVDNIIKPIMMGKGAPAPMLVVFIGALGGFMVSGFIGLFTGAIVLTLGYRLIMAWLDPRDSPPQNAVSVSNPETREPE